MSGKLAITRANDSGSPEDSGTGREWRFTPVAICIVSLSVVAVLELIAITGLRTAKQAAAPAVKSAVQYANEKARVAAEHIDVGREILADGVTQPAKRLDELEQAADAASDDR